MEDLQKIDIADRIVRKVLPKYLKFYVEYTEIQEDGSVQKILTEIGQGIFDEIIKVLEDEAQSKG